jgi:hypothetical protein
MSARERRPNGNVRNQEPELPRKEYVVDILLLAMAVASAVSLAVVSPPASTAKDATHTEGEHPE